MTQAERWATRLGLVLAMAGNAVGLGNFLRFPAQAAKNGGGAFMIPYVVALILMGLPLMWVEWTMGRYGGHFGHHSCPGIFQSMGRSRFWKYFGALSLWSCLVIAAYYLYVESWCMVYCLNSLVYGFQGMNVDQVRGFYDWLTGQRDYELLAISGWGMFFFALCVVVNIYILSRGLAKGIELTSKIGMPLLILFGAVLAVRGLMINQELDPEAKASPFTGLNYVWEPKWNQLGDASVWLAAAGQIFFTLSLGMGSIHCYASYLREKDDVALAGATTAFTNEFCEVILGGTILIPIATAYLGLAGVQEYTQGGSGFGLGFFVFPTLFNKWGAFAPLAGFLWFGLLFFAAITSSLAMGQPIMAFLQQEYGYTRSRSALAFGGLVLVLAVPVAVLHQNSFFDEFDYWAGTVMLVVFALLETILFAWVFGMERGWNELNKGAELWIPKVFYYIIKYVTPLILILILIAYVAEPQGGWHSVRAHNWTSWEFSSGSMIGKILHKDLDERLHKALDENQQKDEDKRVDPEKIRSFYAELRWWRNVDRITMVATFVFFAVLVYYAWRRREIREAGI